jgi:hypothetical protein
VTFDPPDCCAYASGQTLPPGLTDNMAALSAEGEGNRFIAIAVETSEQHGPERSTSTSLTLATIS